MKTSILLMILIAASILSIPGLAQYNADLENWKKESNWMQELKNISPSGKLPAGLVFLLNEEDAELYKSDEKNNKMIISWGGDKETAEWWKDELESAYAHHSFAPDLYQNEDGSSVFFTRLLNDGHVMVINFSEDDIHGALFVGIFEVEKDDHHSIEDYNVQMEFFKNNLTENRPEVAMSIHNEE